MFAIQTKELSKKYKDLIAVNHLNLAIEEGELFALLGVNGAGKTTTIKMLSCLTKPTSGEAFVDGKSILKESQKVKEIIGVSPQETAIASKLSVKENLEFMAGIHGFSKEKTKQKIEELSAKFDLSHILSQKASTLSGGFKRRVSIAMAMIGEPKILFLDEPTLGLDVLARSELWSIIQELKQNVTIILTTHYMEEAETLSDNIGIMKDGQLLALGSAEALKEKAKEETLEKAFIKIVKGDLA